MDSTDLLELLQGNKESRKLQEMAEGAALFRPTGFDGDHL